MSLDQVKAAIMAMQSQPGGAGEASRWLATFEESSAAWQVAWELVSVDEVGSQQAHMYRFFGAKMIYSKIQRDFEQLGAEEGSYERIGPLSLQNLEGQAPSLQALQRTHEPARKTAKKTLQRYFRKAP